MAGSSRKKSQELLVTHTNVKKPKITLNPKREKIPDEILITDKLFRLSRISRISRIIYFEDNFCCGTIILSTLRFSSKARCMGQLGNGKIDIL